MKKSYEVKRDFRIGECNIELKKGSEVVYDDNTSSLFVGDKLYEARNLKAAIKALWLVPLDGVYPELDGPLGETEDEKMDRKRKERFLNQKNKNTATLVKDERSVGVISEENEMFEKILGVESVVSIKSTNKNKIKLDLVEDDTKEVGTATFDNSDVTSLKKAMKTKAKKNQDTTKFTVHNDHFDSDTVKVGKYENESRESTLEGWAKMHWTKKAELISSANDLKFLQQLKGLETSKRIQERIQERLESLQ